MVGLLDGEEDLNQNGSLDEGETDPNNADSDNDGIDDGQELIDDTDPLDPSDNVETLVSGGGCSIGNSSAGFGSLLLFAICFLFAFRRRFQLFFS